LDLVLLAGDPGIDPFELEPDISCCCDEEDVEVSCDFIRENMVAKVDGLSEDGFEGAGGMSIRIVYLIV
jgi:hypothetical protein